MLLPRTLPLAVSTVESAAAPAAAKKRLPVISGSNRAAAARGPTRLLQQLPARQRHGIFSWSEIISERETNPNFWSKLFIGMLKRSVAVGLWLAAACAAFASPSHREVLDKYCVTCHNQRLKTGGLTLDTMDLGKVPAQAEIWEKVIRKLRSGTMPPAGMPRPDAATYNGLAGWLEAQIDQAAAPYAGPPDPAPSESRRICQRDPRSAGAGHRRRFFTASRRFRVWLRQCLRRAGRFAVAAGTLSRCRAENRRAGGGRSEDRAGQRNLANPAGSFAGPARRTACRSARSAERWSTTTFRWTASIRSKPSCIEPI